jgi:hypothetical protein
MTSTAGCLPNSGDRSHNIQLTEIEPDKASSSFSHARTIIIIIIEPFYIAIITAWPKRRHLKLSAASIFPLVYHHLWHFTHGHLRLTKKPGEFLSAELVKL